METVETSSSKQISVSKVRIEPICVSHISCLFLGLDLSLFHDGADFPTDNSHAKEVVFTVKNQLQAGVTVNDRSLAKLGSQALIGSTRVDNRPHFTSSSKSTSLGLNHIALACKGALGSFSLQAAEGTKGLNTAALSTIVLPAFTGSLSQNMNCKQTPAIQKAELLPISLERYFPEGLKICAIDDSSLICKGYERLCLPRLKADMAKSCVCCPTSKTDVDDFLSFVLGKEVTSSCGPADIIIFDQNIDLGHGQVRRCLHMLL